MDKSTDVTKNKNGDKRRILSRVMFHMSHVTLIFSFCLFLIREVELVGGGSVTKGATPSSFSIDQFKSSGCWAHWWVGVPSAVMGQCWGSSGSVLMQYWSNIGALLRQY